MTNLKNYYTSFYYYPLLLIAFLLPFNVGVAGGLSFSLLLYFIFGNKKEGNQLLLKNKWTYIFSLFFLIHALAYFFSSNKAEALTAIEIKLGFIAFPLLIFSQKINDNIFIKVCYSFIFGLTACTLINFIRSFYFFFTENNFLVYSDFSFFMHASYYAMSLVFSIAILSAIKLTIFKKQLHNTIALLFLLILFGSAIIASASKLGILSFILLLPIISAYHLLKQKKIKLLISILIGLSISISIFFQLNISPIQRLKNAFIFTQSSQEVDKTTTESNAVRMLIWKESLTLISEHSFLGVTPGDTNDLLYETYKSKGMTGALSKRLNTHNQYLQTAIGTGIIGALLLLIMTLGIVITGILKKNILLALFGLIIVLNFLVESMLQTQAGALFYVFFSCVLLSVNDSKSPS